MLIKSASFLCALPGKKWHSYGRERTTLIRANFSKHKSNELLFTSEKDCPFVRIYANQCLTDVDFIQYPEVASD